MVNMDISTLQTVLMEREAKEKFSGVVRLTRDGDELFAGAYGYANRPWQIPNSLDLRFDTASMTKLFTAVATLQLIDRGKFGLETAVIPYLGITDTTISDAVSVYHLLTHSSGIGDDAEEENGEDYADLWKERPSYMVTETADFLPQFIHKPPNFAPGTGVRYNNVGFILLGLMIEKASGQRYRDYVREHIFARAGMSRSDFLHMAGVYPDVATGYEKIEDNQPDITVWRTCIYMRPPLGSPDGYAYTTVADMERFWTAVRHNTLISPALTHAFLTPKVLYRRQEDFTYKYGFAVYFVLDSHGETAFYLGEGEDNGVSAKSVYYPKYGVQGVMLANQGFCTWPIVWDVYRLLEN